MSSELVDIATVTLSALAFGLAIFTFIFNHIKVKKTEQVKIGMDITAKLDEAENKSFDLKDQLKKSANDGYLSTADDLILKTQLKDTDLLYMNHWEFYSFLVNNRIIDNDKIKKYFEDNFKSGTDDFFKDYPKYWNNENMFKEVKKLRKAIGHKLKLDG